MRKLEIELAFGYFESNIHERILFSSQLNANHKITQNALVLCTKDLVKVCKLISLEWNINFGFERRNQI